MVKLFIILLIMDIKKLKKHRLKFESKQWWDSLPIQNLYDITDSWVGYCWKYYPDRGSPYGLTDQEILYIYIKEKK